MEKNLTTAISEAARKIKDSGVIAVILPEELTAEVIGSAAALTYGLRKIGKAVNVFGPSLSNTKELMPWHGLGEKNEPPREFIISFDLARSPIKELKYQRDTNRLDIILLPAGGAIRREDVEFRYGASRYDLAITLGISSLKSPPQSIKAVPEILYEKPIINIDSSPANTAYGEINLLSSAKTGAGTMPEMIYDLLVGLRAKPESPEASSALLVALYAATNNFASARANAFAVAGALAAAGGSTEIVRRYLSSGRTLGQDQLAARAIARTRWDEPSKILWSTLTQDDFDKTGASPRDLPKVMARIKEIALPAGFCVLLYQVPAEGVVAAAVSGESGAEGKLGELFVQSNYLADGYSLNEYFSSFAAAEERVLQLLTGRNGVE